MIKVIFFDIDNTLLSFDEYVRDAMRTGFALFRIGTYDESMFGVFQTVNNALWQEIEQGTLTLEELRKFRWNRIFSALGLSFDGPTFETFFRERLNESAIPEPGAVPVLESLSRKYPLCAASNGPYRQQENRLRIAGMLPYFSHLFISGELGAPKPSALFFDGCMERLKKGASFPLSPHFDKTAAEQIRPEEILMVGDSLTADMDGAAAYGMQTCFYNPKGLSVSAKPHLTLEIRTLPELLNLL